MIYVLALLIGVIAGLRAMTAPAAIAWAAWLGWINLAPTWGWFMGSIWIALLFTAMAAGELVTDQLPNTPSRKVPVQFAARLFMGALCGFSIGSAFGSGLVGGLLGIIGAALGTYGGAALRAKLAANFGKDPPAAFIEDAIAIVGAFLIIASLPRPL
jgi:uncharacterized membrane protein